ncbi:MAG: NADH-quinone oxidoreductase subunit K [Verrucomicrobiota bacterium]
MEIALAILTGLLAAAGAYLLLERNLFRILLGLALIAQAANLLVFSAVGLRGLTTPIIKKGATALEEGHPDPLAQALVLTAIVISFGVLAFCLTLLKKAHRRSRESDITSLSVADS